MAKKHWQARRAYARRLVALRAAYRAARQEDTESAWRAAARAIYAARHAQAELIRRPGSGVPPSAAWRLHDIGLTIWQAGSARGWTLGASVPRR